MRPSVIYRILFFLLLASCQENINQQATPGDLLAPNDLNYAIAETGKLWDREARSQKNTVKLSVFIHGGTLEDQILVQSEASKWTTFGNIDFTFQTKEIEGHEYDITVKIHNDKNEVSKGGTSYVGTDSKKHGSIEESSMNLWINSDMPIDLRRRYIIHEFGHALGLRHEHAHPERTFTFDEKKTLADCRRMKWSRRECKNFKLNTLKGRKYMFFEYDAGSIMHYSIHQDNLIGDYDERILSAATELSLMDKIAIAELYPGRMTKDEVIVEHDKKAHSFQKSIEEIDLIIESGRHLNCEITHYYSDDTYMYAKANVSFTKGTNGLVYQSREKIIKAIEADSRCSLNE